MYGSWCRHIYSYVFLWRNFADIIKGPRSLILKNTERARWILLSDEPLKKDKLFLEGDVKCEKDSIWERSPLLTLNMWEVSGRAWVTLTVHVHLSSQSQGLWDSANNWNELGKQILPHTLQKEAQPIPWFSAPQALSRDLSHVITELLAYRTTS